jgi:nucleoid-associated protein YgaU
MALQLAKASIVDLQSGDRIPVMYNPEEYRLEQGNSFAEVGVPGLPAPPLQYVRGKMRSLSMDLFFDSYERGSDVRVESGKVVRLLDKTPETHAPPVLLFAMGRFTFRCVLVDANQRYTMFLQDGTPVRVIVSVRFQEYMRPELDVERGLFIGPPTLHNIAAGEKLVDLAARYLGDAGRWREIATANNIDDPFALQPGSRVVIPGKSQ